MRVASVSLVAVAAAAWATRARAAPPKHSKEEIAAIRAACDAHQPACDWAALFGEYEQIALARSLGGSHLTIDPSPWGKTLRAIIVDNQDVFGPDDGPLTLLNVFHRTSRKYVIEREVLLRPGQVWEQSLVDQTMRKLRDVSLTAVVAAVPIQTGDPGTVDLLVVTRDVWSIRLNSGYEVQSGKFTYLTVSLSENNLMGWRKLLAMVFTMDQGEYEIGPAYIDRNFLGQQKWVIGHAGLIFNRGTSKWEGSESSIEVSQPLWSLDSHWGAGVTWTHRFDISRSFLGTHERTYDDPNTPGDDQLPWQYRERNFSLTTSAVRQWPGRIEQQLRFGHILADQRPSLYQFPSMDPAVQANFIRDVLPRSERSSQLFLAYTAFTPRYRAFHDIDTFDLAEDVQLGPNVTVTGGLAFHQIGSENNFARLSTTASWSEPFDDDGLWTVAASSEHRFDDGGVIDDLATFNARVATPQFSIGRVIFAADAETRWNETQNRFLSAGGDSGLRGFIIAQFTGQRRAVGHVELRTKPIATWFLRSGAVAFWDIGGAGNAFGSLPIHDDVGVGLRILVPQTSTEVLRFDWALALDGDHRGLPGRFIAGYRQAF